MACSTDVNQSRPAGTSARVRHPAAPTTYGGCDWKGAVGWQTCRRGAKSLAGRQETALPRPFATSDARHLPALIGCDEVGRGPLAGPVVAAAVWFVPGALPPGLLAALDDSKKLGGRERSRLAALIRTHCRFALAAASAPAIDRIDIRQASLGALRLAVLRVGMRAPVLVDGRDVPTGLADAGAVIGGDGLVPQIAAASILAKVLRDGVMARLALRHPGYGFERNAGYGTAEHRAALARLGPTAHHRRSFAPVAAVIRGACSS